MAVFVLKYNLFEFNSKSYKQISGTAIGNLVLCMLVFLWTTLRTEFLKTQDIKPWFRRDLLMAFFIWTESEESLEKFLEDLNKFHPNLKFTYEKSKEKINFLDVVIKIKKDRAITDLYCKPTNGQQYLPYGSCHADHIKRLIIFSETLRAVVLWCRGYHNCTTSFN